MRRKILLTAAVALGAIAFGNLTAQAQTGGATGAAQAGGQVGGQIGAQTGSQIGGQVGAQAGGSVGAQVGQPGQVPVSPPGQVPTTRPGLGQPGVVGQTGVTQGLTQPGVNQPVPTDQVIPGVDATTRIQGNLDARMQQPGTLSTQGNAQMRAGATVGAENNWRYQFHNGRWWYWMGDRGTGRWAYHDGSRWFDPSQRTYFDSQRNMGYRGEFQTDGQQGQGQYDGPFYFDRDGRRYLLRDGRYMGDESWNGRFWTDEYGNRYRGVYPNRGAAVGGAIGGEIGGRAGANIGAGIGDIINRAN